MRRKVVYLSGPMSLMKTQDIWMKKFKYYEDYWKGKGYEVVNPASPIYSQSYGDNMRNALKLLLDCDCIFFLPNSILSSGARTEYEVAKSCGMDILLDDEDMSFTDNFQTKNNVY